MDFGIYVHIPYCIQRCHYCDFATYERSRILPPEDYVYWLREEIRQRQSGVPFRALKTIYFGGGTPSLLPAPLIVTILDELAKHGFTRSESTEVTIEINPATIDAEKLKIYLEAGINRFSVGAQSFNNRLLKSLGREHDVDDTLKTLELLSSHGLNFSFDLLFALPTQELSDLREDLDRVKDFGPGHISTYCLTLMPEHPLNRNRPPEEDQLAMFDLISSELESEGYCRYEISNFAKAGMESQHNLLYWTDKAYWGLGLSAHSYLPLGDWGARFWNHSSMKLYLDQIQASQGKSFEKILDSFGQEQKESPRVNQSLTDLCHTSLRLAQGLDLAKVSQKFGSGMTQLVRDRIDSLVDSGWFWQPSPSIFSLTDKGRLVSNRIFEELTFLPDELPTNIDIPR